MNYALFLELCSHKDVIKFFISEKIKFRSFLLLFIITVFSGV